MGPPAAADVGLNRALTDLAGGGGRVRPVGIPRSGGRGTPPCGWGGLKVVAVVVKVLTCGGGGTMAWLEITGLDIALKRQMFVVVKE